MSDILNELKKMRAEKLTENGDKAYNTTGDDVTDLFFMTAYFEKHLDEAHIGTSEREKLLSMYIRDPRFGLGRRDLGRRLMEQAEISPEWVVKAGRYDDLYKMSLNNAELLADYLAFLKEYAKHDALAKKWLPRLTGKDRKIAKLLAHYWGMTQKEYRAFIKTDDTTEYKLSYAVPSESATPLNELFNKGSYEHPLVNEIDFEKVPSNAMAKYLHCFSTREDFKDRFAEYIQKVRENKAKVNTKTSNVHDAYKVATRSISAQSVEEEARDVVSKKIVEEATLGVEIDAIPILDTSGSMYSGWGWYHGPDFTDADQIGVKAMSVAYAIASMSTYAPNQVISFSSHPQLIEIKGDTMQERYKSMYTGDCSNTDFGAVMRLLAKLKKYPKYFIVLTDMEFDIGSNDSKKDTMRIIQEAGAHTRIIWWNFNDRSKTSPEFDEYGNIYLSGYNMQMLKLLENDFDMTKFIDKVLEKYAKDIDWTVNSL